MNKDWSNLNKRMQGKLKKEETFKDGIAVLIELRDNLFAEIISWKKQLSEEQLNAIPFINAKGLHNNTIAYSLWHVFRIEDIVCNTLVNHREEIFFKNDYKLKMNAPLITTGNELEREAIQEFSKKLNIEELFNYVSDVKKSTDEFLKKLKFETLAKKSTEDDRKYLLSLNVVSTDEEAFGLVDYWCSKDVRGLIQMPFSRHWIMHVEACLRIKNKLLT